MAFVLYGAVAAFHPCPASVPLFVAGISVLTGTLQTTGFDFLWAFPLIVEQFIGCSGFSCSWK